ncbi:MAG: ribonuclease III [Holosporaceae bacterium]|jgi:ribonuclease III|nr:ribonuclease III [Holosporaceae bacterium]
MDAAVSDGIAALENILGYKFKSLQLIAAAISHPGIGKADKISAMNFERLEFLGDRVLGLAISSILYEKFPNDSEGNLATRVAALAGTDFIITLCQKKEIVDCFLVPKSFFLSKSKSSSAIADMMEAVLGSIFLDSNFETARAIIAKLWGRNITKTEHKKKDSKTQLQELLQSVRGELPVYSQIEMIGKSHDPTFKIEAKAAGLSAIGIGNSKKNAERDAAEKMLKKLKEQRVQN